MVNGTGWQTLPLRAHARVNEEGGSGRAGSTIAAILRPRSARSAGSAELLASDGKARAAAARGGRIGIVDFEGGANEIVDKVDLGAGEILQRNGVNQYARTCTLDHEIVRFGGGNEVKLVGEAGTAAALHAHAQEGGTRLPRGDLGDALGRAL